MHARRLILASSSPYRREQLRSLGFDFDTDSPDIVENMNPDESPCEMALRLSREKAIVVAARHAESVVIGADQVAEIRGEVLSKPGTEAKARTMLAKLSGNQAQFHSAVTVIDHQREVESFVETTGIEFRCLNTSEIAKYVELDQPLNCAGAIKSESRGSLLFRRVTSSDPSALVGLPLIQLSQILRSIGINPLN